MISNVFLRFFRSKRITRVHISIWSGSFDKIISSRISFWWSRLLFVCGLHCLIACILSTQNIRRIFYCLYGGVTRVILGNVECVTAAAVAVSPICKWVHPHLRLACQGQNKPCDSPSAFVNPMHRVLCITWLFHVAFHGPIRI